MYATKSSTRIARRVRARRLGAATVEFAFAAPILFLMIFVSIEMARVQFVRHTATNAAYEAARRGIVPGVTADDVRDEANLLLDTAAISGATVTVTPSDITPTTEEITVDITIPMDNNGWIFPVFMEGKSVSASTTLAREYYGHE